jgi:DNA mismatch repair protein MSH5
VYFKNSQVREMDGHFGDLYGMILAQFVLEYETLMVTVSDICGELDR